MDAPILKLSSFERACQKLTPAQLDAVDSALLKLPGAFGRPHLHSGISIRTFGPYYECRAGLNLRVLFVWRHGSFVLAFVGDHRAVANFIKS